MAQLVDGADAFEALVTPLLGGLLDTEGQIGEHLYDDWNSQLVNTGSASPRFGFRSKEGSTLSGSGSLSGDALNASYRFASFDGDSLAFALTATARETGSGASASGNLSLTLASGKGTRTRDDDIACTMKANYKYAETPSGVSSSGSAQISYSTGTGIALSLQGGGSYRASGTNKSGNQSITMTYVDADGNRLELKGTYVYQVSDRRDDYTLKLDKLLVVDGGKTLVNLSRVTLREPIEGFDVSDFGFSFNQQNGFETGFSGPEDIYVTLAGVLTSFAETLGT